MSSKPKYSQVGGIEMGDQAQSDDHDTLINKSDGFVTRQLRNPRVFKGVLCALVILVILIVAQFAYIGTHINNTPAAPDDSGQCPTEFVPALFEAVFKDWLAQVASYDIEARAVCSVPKAQLYTTLLNRNHASLAGILLDANNCDVKTTTSIMASLTTSAKLLIDASMPCPCSAGSVFGSCDDPKAAAAAQQQFTTASNAMLTYVHDAIKSPYGNDQLTDQWIKVSQSMGAFILAGRKFGVDSDNFYETLQKSLNEITAFGEMLDYQD